jgi:hypothetical protein
METTVPRLCGGPGRGGGHPGGSGTEERTSSISKPGRGWREPRETVSSKIPMMRREVLRLSRSRPERLRRGNCGKGEGQVGHCWVWYGRRAGRGRCLEQAAPIPWDCT